MRNVALLEGAAVRVGARQPLRFSPLVWTKRRYPRFPQISADESLVRLENPHFKRF